MSKTGTGNQEQPETGPGDSGSDLPRTVGRSDLEEVRPVSRSQVSMTQLMDPQDVNLLGTVFGGTILAAVDRIAYVCASRHAGRACVTASFDQVDFRSPVSVGEILTLKASLNTVGRTSMEVGVRVTAESVHGSEHRHTNSCYVTMVAVDEDRNPVPVPKLRLETREELRRHRDAEERRKARLELAERRKELRREEG